MRKLNCKEVNEALKKEIMDSYESAEEYYTFDGAEMKTEYNDICKDILEAFKREKLDNDLTGEYWGNCYINNKAIGDYTADSSTDIEKTFEHLAINWN